MPVELFRRARSVYNDGHAVAAAPAYQVVWVDPETSDKEIFSLEAE
ncbi:MAG: hypothetical protein AB1894_20325 [Chloroflexota bacterium]